MLDARLGGIASLSFQIELGACAPQECSMFDSIGFIGAGRVAQIMLGGWQRTSTVLPDTGAFDVSPGAVAALQAEFPAVKPESLAQVAGRELIFIALPPPAVNDVLALILPHLSETAVVVSLAPKIRLPALQTLLARGLRA
jgi:pyrroline-5-carboxylate reductase